MLRLLAHHRTLTGREVQEEGGLAQGTAYATLARLEVDKLVLSYKDDKRVGRGQSRRHFEITKSGLMALELADYREKRKKAKYPAWDWAPG